MTSSCGSTPRPKATRSPCRSRAGRSAPPAGPRLASILGGASEAAAARVAQRMGGRRGAAAHLALRRSRRAARRRSSPKPPAQPLTRDRSARGRRARRNAADQRARGAARLHRPARAQPRATTSASCVLSGEVVTAADGGFAGFRGTARARRRCASRAAPDAVARVRSRARRGASLAARPHHRKRRADRRARRRPAAQRLCELRQRHRRRRAPPAVGPSRDERGPGAGQPDRRPGRACGRSRGHARIAAEERGVRIELDDRRAAAGAAARSGRSSRSSST